MDTLLCVFLMFSLPHPCVAGRHAQHGSALLQLQVAQRSERNVVNDAADATDDVLHFVAERSERPSLAMIGQHFETLHDLRRFSNDPDLVGCDLSSFESICDTRHSAYYEALRESVKASPSQESLFGNSQSADEIIDKMCKHDKHVPCQFPWGRDQFKQDLEALSRFTAWDVFAFRETWTEDDSELLRQLNASFTSDVLIGGSFAALLPSKNILQEIVQKRDLAIVGSGPSLAFDANEIDKHNVVARFNTLIGDKLDSLDTGRKTDIHVMNVHVPPSKGDVLLEIDLEGTVTHRSYCKRMLQGGEFEHSKLSPTPLLLFKPSAFCALVHRKLWAWSRGFLFYWFVGRLFEIVDIYGMGVSDGRSHHHSYIPANASDRKDTIMEAYLDAEHLLYDVENVTRDV